MRPTMRFVPAKTAEQQAAVLLDRGRERLVRQRMMLVNALRAHVAEFGVIAPQGLRVWEHSRTQRRDQFPGRSDAEMTARAHQQADAGQAFVRHSPAIMLPVRAYPGTVVGFLQRFVFFWIGSPSKPDFLLWCRSMTTTGTASCITRRWIQGQSSIGEVQSTLVSVPFKRVTGHLSLLLVV